jgi:non-specific serine/threonine protein kinase
MASGLWEYWLIRGLLEEGAAWLDDALQRAPARAGARAEALTGLAVMTSIRGEFLWGGEFLAASIALHEQIGDLQGQVRAQALLGFWRANLDDWEGAAVALGRALALAGPAADRYSAAFALLMAAMVAALCGDTALARTRAADSADLFTGIGDQRGAGYARCVQADCLISDGAPADALGILQVCVGTSEALLDRWGLLISTSSVARAQAALGEWRLAAFTLGVADSLSERIGGRLFPGVQAAIDVVAGKTTAELGPAAIPEREAGRRVGRGDRIASALRGGNEPAPLAPAYEELALTRRENEITKLIGAGLTNRQIAERLFIAQRTVDTHVGHILAKLGCSNRSQVAALTGPHRPAGHIYAPG